MAASPLILNANKHTEMDLCFVCFSNDDEFHLNSGQTAIFFNAQNPRKKLIFASRKVGSHCTLMIGSKTKMSSTSNNGTTAV